MMDTSATVETRTAKVPKPGNSTSPTCLMAPIASAFAMLLASRAPSERLKQERGRVQRPTTPARALLQQLRAGLTDDEQRHVAGLLAKAFEQVEQRRLGPMNVIDADHERTMASQVLQHTPHSPEDLIGAARLPTEPEQREQHRHDGALVRRSVH